MIVRTKEIASTKNGRFLLRLYPMLYSPRSSNVSVRHGRYQGRTHGGGGAMGLGRYCSAVQLSTDTHLLTDHSLLFTDFVSLQMIRPIQNTRRCICGSISGPATRTSCILSPAALARQLCLSSGRRGPTQTHHMWNGPGASVPKLQCCLGV